MKTLNGKFEYNNARTGLRSVAGFKLDVQPKSIAQKCPEQQLK